MTMVFSVQPGVASVQCAILQKAPGSVSFNLCKFNQLAGLEYGEIRRRFSGAVICGIVRSESFVPLLNPAPDEKLEENDRIIALAPEGKLESVLSCTDSSLLPCFIQSSKPLGLLPGDQY